MTKIEWNQTFSWVVGLYPNWKPDVGVQATWFDEIGRMVDQNNFRAAVRVCGVKNPSAFAPGVFEIKHEIDCAKSGGELKEIAESVWLRVREVYHDLNRGVPVPQMRGCTRAALQTIGGFRAIGDCLEGEMKWLQKRFIEAWVAARQNEERAELMGIAPAGEQGKLSADMRSLIGKTVKTFPETEKKKEGGSV